MIQLNHTRADFAEKFEELIASYNAGSRSIEELFEELLKLSNSLSEEQERHVRENMTEEELVIFDILTRPAPELSAEERAEVKKVARELLARLKGLVVLNWRQKSAARSQLKLTIEDALDLGCREPTRRKSISRNARRYSSMFTEAIRSEASTTSVLRFEKSAVQSDESLSTCESRSQVAEDATLQDLQVRELLQNEKP